MNPEQKDIFEVIEKAEKAEKAEEPYRNLRGEVLPWEKEIKEKEL